MLGESPYLISDATAVMPGVNAPNVASQPLWLPDMYGNRFIKLDPDDYTVVVTGPEVEIPGDVSLANPLALDILFDVTWDGDINDTPWQDALPGFCMPMEYGVGAAGDIPSNGSGCDLMKNDEEEIKLFFVIWDVRWVEEGNEDFLNSPTLVDGFPKNGVTAMDPVNAPVSSPMHADNTGPMPDMPFVPVLDADGGMGIKWAADPDETVSFTAQWLLGEDPFKVYKDHPDFGDNDKARVGFSLFVYRVPEPGTGLLLVSGLIGLAAFGRRRRA
jgi:hypothetical protein